MNIQSKNKLDSPNTFLTIVVTVSKKIVLRKTRLKLKFRAQSSLKLCNSRSGIFFIKSFWEFILDSSDSKNAKKKNFFFWNTQGGSPP